MEFADGPAAIRALPELELAVIVAGPRCCGSQPGREIGLQLESSVRSQMKRQSGWSAIRRRGHRSDREMGECILRTGTGLSLPTAALDSPCALAPAQSPRGLVDAESDQFHYPGRYHATNAEVPNGHLTCHDLSGEIANGRLFRVFWNTLADSSRTSSAMLVARRGAPHAGPSAKQCLLPSSSRSQASRRGERSRLV